jgi:hypothetical protein
VAKSNRPLTLKQGQEGQISIFFSASLVVLITIVAFVINVGLFVKAKINLQNATDAAAFSGAAVQARQLTTIAYLNWEMRNIYKEWMYKYYVIGNLNVQDVEETDSRNEPMSFRLRPDVNVLAQGPARSTPDPYNFPAVCIHLADSQTNICKRYAIPGLPEFGSSNLPGAEEASRAFIDTLIGTKINDCIDRTRLNMLVASTWAFNVLGNPIESNSFVNQGPAVLADRQGAWPRALELAMRLRNLERIVNRPPQTGGVCASGGTEATDCQVSIDSIISQPVAGNERVVKAFYSGYRNLGSQEEDEMRRSFTLTEIPPRPVIPDGGANSPSLLLVPGNRQQDPKHYLDLKLMMVNFAVFYAAMIPRGDRGNAGALGVSGACDVSKVAIPVPGYPLGYYKNPEVATYYAVKGEAEFVGMFNPFTPRTIKLTAYSAAKPFGGRIGPALFVENSSNNGLVSRQDGDKKRSVPYIASLDLTQIPNKATGQPLGLGNFTPGAPLPINFQNDFFWLETARSVLGGRGTGDVQFGIPNLVYDYEQPYLNTGYTAAEEEINMLAPRRNGEGDDRSIGLFSREQFRRFKGELPAQVTQDVLINQIRRVRAATLYEAGNYLVPSPVEFNLQDRDAPLDSFGFITDRKRGTTPDGTDYYQAAVYAPLYAPDQEDVLWRGPEDVVRTVFDFLREQEPAIQKYRRSLNKGAFAIARMGENITSEARGSAQQYVNAARGVSDINFSQVTDFDQPPGSCASISGSFLYYFYGSIDPDVVRDNQGCPRPLGQQLQEYFALSSQSGIFSASHYQTEFSWRPANFPGNRGPLASFSAYMPGPFTGVADTGIFSSPIRGSGITENMRRNSYSTKFVALDSLRGSNIGYSPLSNFTMYSEGNLPINSGDIPQRNLRNELDAQAVGLDLNSIKY